MSKNNFGKTRNVKSPYAIYTNGIGDYYILKTYKMAKNENSQYDRWFTYCNGDYGDMYKQDILNNSVCIYAEKDWRKTYHG